ncbi:Na(+)/H(+) antiporter NhaP [Aquicella siphonis]|uniref:Na(+)/H(+) antiporter NhaP n=1 Tax=Aquicella siphonis TaxID=254247 RepID=A0A5E4PGN3_9COXI|nr:sodium:proton antiporter [Aquicella siphonis]VVC75745.1 Na(+)/H(+) antiporter NhaP [Aquicella siphonis]
MNLFDISAIVLTASAIGSFVNHKWIRLPSSIGLLLLAMGLGFAGIFLQKIGVISNEHIELFLSSINFNETVFHGMLSFLLFAGSLQINIEDLKSAKLPIAMTATISTLLSTLMIGLAFFMLANRLGFENITLLYAMLFGAILSPTDPIAALSIIKKMRASKKIETIITGESLFNDGVAIVIFLTIIEILHSNGEAGFAQAAEFLLLEAGGGIVFGGIIGWIAYRMLLKIDDMHVELFIMLAVVTGGYTLAEKLRLSAPLAMVVAGIIIGNHGRSHAMSDHSRIYLDAFWEAIDEILNTVLFFLIGLEMMVINATAALALLGAACILIALSARFVSIAIPMLFLKPFYKARRGAIIILTWGGLRGALSIAMVLSLQEQSIKAIFLPCIYFVVIFSIAVQGLTFSKILRKYKMELQSSSNGA